MMGKFKFGDKVICVNCGGSEKLVEGRLYTIADDPVEDADGDIFVAIDHPNNSGWFEWRFRLATPEEIAKREHKFAAGDKVRITDAGYHFWCIGDEAVVEELTALNYRGQPTYMCSGKGTYKNQYIREDQMELVEPVSAQSKPKHKFAVGDKARVVVDTSMDSSFYHAYRAGDCVTIRKFVLANDSIPAYDCIREGDTYTQVVPETHIEAITPEREPEVITPEIDEFAGFRVGDTVVCVDPNCEIDLNDKATITHLRMGSPPTMVRATKLQDKFNGQFYPSRFRLLQRDGSHYNPFAIGDYVLCVNAKNASNSLREGQVYEVDTLNAWDVYLKGEMWSWLSSRFRFATPVEIDEYKKSLAASKEQPATSRTLSAAAGDYLYLVGKVKQAKQDLTVAMNQLIDVMESLNIGEFFYDSGNTLFKLTDIDGELELVARPITVAK